MFKIFFVFFFLLFSGWVFADVVFSKGLPDKNKVFVEERIYGDQVGYYIYLKKNGRTPIILIHKRQLVANRFIFFEITDPNVAVRRFIFKLSFNAAASGDGHGQCGAGIEEYLFVVDIEKTPSVINRIPVGSCFYGIGFEPGDSVISIEGNVLRINYSYVSEFDGPANAVLSLDSNLLIMKAGSSDLLR